MKTETRTHVAILAALLMCLTAFAGCTDGATTAPTPGGSTPPVTTAPTNVPAPTDAALEIIEVSYLIPESTSIDFPYSFEDRPALKKNSRSGPGAVRHRFDSRNRHSQRI